MSLPMSSHMINTEQGLRSDYQRFKIPVINRNVKCSQQLYSTSRITLKGFVTWVVLSCDSWVVTSCVWCSKEEETAVKWIDGITLAGYSHIFKACFEMVFREDTVLEKKLQKKNKGFTALEMIHWIIINSVDIIANLKIKERWLLIREW